MHVYDTQKDRSEAYLNNIKKKHICVNSHKKHLTNNTNMAIVEKYV